MPFEHVICRSKPMFVYARLLRTTCIELSVRICPLRDALLAKGIQSTLLRTSPLVQSTLVLQRSASCLCSPSASKLFKGVFTRPSAYASVSQFSAEERLKILAHRSLRKAGVLTSDMDATILWPPEGVRGMKELNVEAFQKAVEVPIAKVALTHIAPALKVLKKYFLKLRNFNAIEKGPTGADYKVTFLNPLSFTGNETKILEEIEQLCKKEGKDWSTCSTCPVEFEITSITLQYENWTASEALTAVLPLEQNGVSGYSIIGHIIHLNLKEDLEPFKKIIGRILLDKSPSEVTMVVNKVDTIDNSDNTFRCFSMEILAGSGDTIATIKENMCRFTFDFAKVYWNPRLSTEHEAIIAMLQTGDVLYDVMAGVGPFSIPAAVQKKCRALCNDLNPESFRWLTHNISLNKVTDRVSSYNLDGGEFIRTVLKQDLDKRWRDPDFSGQIHVAMNLPSIAVEFLSNFVGLMSDVECSDGWVSQHELCAHVYMFSKDQKASSCATRVAFHLGLVDNLPDFDGEFSEKLEEIATAMKRDPAIGRSQENLEYLKSKFVKDDFDIPGLILKEMKFVRKVAPNKAMIRASVVISRDILMRKGRALTAEERLVDSGESNAGNKRIKLDFDVTSA